MSGIPQPRGQIPVRGGQGRPSGLPQPASALITKTKTLYATPLPEAQEPAAPRRAPSGLKAPRQPAGNAPAPMRGIPQRSAGASGTTQRSETRTTETVIEPGGKKTTTTTTTTSSNYGRPARNAPAPMKSIPQRSTRATGSTQPVETTTSQTVVEPSGRKTTTSTTTRYASLSPFKEKIYPDRPVGRYYIPPKHKPWSKEGKTQQFSSPQKLRSRMDEGKGAPNYMILPQPKDVRDYQILQKHPAHKGLISGNVQIKPSQDPSEFPLSPRRYMNNSGLESHISPDMIGDDWDTSADNVPSPLQRETERNLLETSIRSPDKSFKAQGAKQTVTSPKVIMTDRGPVEVSVEIKTSQKLLRSPNQPEIVEKRVVGTRKTSPGKALQTEFDIQKLDPKTKRKSPERGKEVVQITSSVVIAPGIKQITKTVEFEGVPGGKKSPDPKQVSMLVDQETADVNKTKGLMMPDVKSSSPSKYGVKKKVEIEQLTSLNVSLLERSINHQPKIVTGDEEIEETSPEVIANMLNTEERGLTMDSSPANVYSYLFPEAKTEPITNVSSAAPAPLQDIVVPSVTLPDQVKENIQSANAMQISMRIEREGNEEISTKAFTEEVGSQPIKPNNVAKKGKRKKKTTVAVLAGETPPWGIKDLDPVVDVVGGPPAGTMIAEKNADLPEELDPTVDGIEYMLQMEHPQHFSRVQLRGSQKPPWFPGYYVALPQYPEVIKLAKSPSAVFSSAWKATQPDIFAEESMVVV